MPVAPGGGGQRITMSLPHASATSALPSFDCLRLVYSLRSPSAAGHALPGLLRAHRPYAWSEYSLSCSLVMSTFDSPNIFITLGPTRKPITSAMIASTIMISMMVMPRWRLRVRVRLRRFMRLSAIAINMARAPSVRSRERAHVHDGLQDGEHDEADGAAHHDEHQRLEQRGHAR